MLIDSCSSGGRRNDLETLRRAVPLLRSDYLRDPLGQQQHSYGIPLWMPYYGTGADVFNAWRFRSCLCPWMTIGPDMRVANLPFDEARRLLAQWISVRDLYLADYYPLSAYDTGEQSWMAWQFNSIDTGRGVVQVFRRAQSPYEAARYRLHGLEAGATYVVTDLDRPDAASTVSGQELMDNGLRVEIPERQTALLLTYTRQAAAP
jgi:alpha-galactosidase